MTTLWADGFDSNSATDLLYDYVCGSTPGFVAGRRAGGFALSINTTSRVCQRSLSSSPSTIFASVAIKTAETAASDLFSFDEGSITHITLLRALDGAIYVARGGSGGVALGTSTLLAPSNIWTWFQIKVVIHATLGSVEIRDSGGAVRLNLTNQNTKNGGTGIVNEVILGGRITSSTYAYDDLHVWDSTGSICNTFTDESRVDAIFPSAAGDVTQWTPSVGTNWDCVNENPVVTTDYVSSSTPGNQDLYAFTDLPHVPVSIYGLTVAAVATKDEVGARSFKLLTKRSSLNTGATQALSLGSWLRYTNVVEADPGTSAAWTPTTVNAAQFGIEAL